MNIFIEISLCIVVVCVCVFKVLSNKNWKLIHTVFGYDAYFQIVGKLDKEGIKYKTKTPLTSIDKRVNPFKDNTQYDIYVKKNDEHKANKALQK